MLKAAVTSRKITLASRSLVAARAMSTKIPEGVRIDETDRLHIRKLSNYVDFIHNFRN